MRHHVHITVTNPAWYDVDAVITVTLNASDDQMAEMTARALLAEGLQYDVCEIEEADE
jgi:hypothetical protein